MALTKSESPQLAKGQLWACAWLKSLHEFPALSNYKSAFNLLTMNQTSNLTPFASKILGHSILKFYYCYLTVIVHTSLTSLIC